MIIQQDVQSFCVLSEDSLRSAIQKIDANKHGFVCCVSAEGILEGLLTDGDVRRFLMQATIVNLDAPALDVANKSFVAASKTEAPGKINSLFSDKIEFVPLLDSQRRLVGLARARGAAEGLMIGDTAIGPEAPVFIIAEIGLNHNGSVERAKKLIDASAEAGVDCAKFQMRNMLHLYRGGAEGSSGEDLGAQYTLNLLKQFELPVESMLELFEYTRRAGLIPLCTPWDKESLRVLDDNGMAGFKIASADMTNHDLLVQASRTYKPLIVSTGMSTDEEISETVNLLQHHGASYALLHCNSTYPTPTKDVQLNYLKKLKRMGQCVVGYSGHERGFHIPVASVALGAKIVEKHITLDRDLEGSDHKVSLLPAEFKEMVQHIRDVEVALGSGETRFFSQGETMNRANLAKSLVAGHEIKQGELIDRTSIEIRSPGRGVQPNLINQLIGRTARRDFKAGDFFFPSDLEDQFVQPRDYFFKRPWGVAVRWHDFKPMLAVSNPDFLEFHLSFKDMDEDYLTYFDEPLDMNFTVHSPDLFDGDHLLDLSNEDKAHRMRSIQELQRVIDITRNMKPFFKKATTPLIITSLGGFSTQGLISPEDVKVRYGLLQESLEALDDEGVEVIAQTLPPFPWYFGGQMYLNLFVNPHDTAEFCKETNFRICFDVCHSQLACNHFGWSFEELTDILAPHTAHLHIADADGVDGEGLQISEGIMNFDLLKKQLTHHCPDASFIPEIWQGHKNNGEGFWLACERLETMGW